MDLYYISEVLLFSTKIGSSGYRTRIASLKCQSVIHYTVKTCLEEGELIGEKVHTLNSSVVRRRGVCGGTAQWGENRTKRHVIASKYTNMLLHHVLRRTKG